MLFVSQNEKLERLRSCTACKYFEKSTGSCGPLIKGKRVQVKGKKVKLCGCVMKIKAGLKYAECPLEKWSSVYTEDQWHDLRAFVETLQNRIDTGGQVTLSGEDRQRLMDEYFRASGRREELGNCAACHRNMIKTMMKYVRETEQVAEIAV